MEGHDRLQKMRTLPTIAPEEEKIRDTIRKSMEVYDQHRQNQLMTYREFLWSQLQYTRKRWWVLQTGLLLLAWQVIPAIGDIRHRVRSTGIIGCLFVIFMIPELWRNRETDSTQVEAACLYSLRQIYAARITLFGIVDVALLTLFSLSLGRMGFTLTEVISQFLLPVTVTAGICFSLLCGRQGVGETVSLAVCLGWCGGWWLILMNEQIYRMIAPSVWAGLFGAALAFLALAVRRTLGGVNQYWEVETA